MPFNSKGRKYTAVKQKRNAIAVCDVKLLLETISVSDGHSTPNFVDDSRSIMIPPAGRVDFCLFVGFFFRVFWLFVLVGVLLLSLLFFKYSKRYLY